MHRDVAKVNVQKTRTRFTQNSQQPAQFHIGNLPWLIAYLLGPKTAKEMRWRLRSDVNWLKRIWVCIFSFLRNDDWSASFQTGDLPVDMQHLRFEKCRAITSDDRACVGR